MTKLNQLTNADSPAEWAKSVNNTFGAELRASHPAPGFVWVEFYEDAPSTSLLIQAAQAQGLHVSDVGTTDECAFCIQFEQGGGAQ